MRKTHLVGTVPLASARDVMTRVAGCLGDHVDRIPDGETGGRLAWVGWQHGRIASHPALRPSEQLDHYGRPALFRLRDGADAGALRFETLGYADVALESFATFAELQSQGVIPAGTKFQVNLPTPLGILAAFFDLESQAGVEPAIVDAMMRDLDRITRALDPRRIAIQWDVAIEFAILKAGLPIHFADQQAGIVARLARLGNAVPPAVDLGFHFCFGDLDHKHFVEPESLEPMVDLALAVSEAVARPIAWFHMPVPRDRADDGYFAPLLDYQLDAELFLGLVHLTDGIEGARRRAEAAGRFIQDFGIATECGLGRRPPETIPSLLELHREACGTL